ncbi:GNAT family N-acetyltransferase [Actinopolymorpha pittospori]|uniref:N-acetyltransferase domain-containing protein n=1 Tax=Actinopolymorpha pittospori TaxID=648752 RepID=A0A927RA59_9ACTN|nr:GNAT family protein [Actinopolymorpha pittospori]MBE1608612.1 hypothetical protein [Actinopolymorpha pittospori]
MSSAHRQYPSRLELLRSQAGAFLDARGRIAGCYGVTIASCADGQALWIGASVPNDAATELTAALDRAPQPVDPSEPPPALAACERILARIDGELTCASGPSYVIPDDVIADDSEFAVGTTIARSVGADTEALRGANPGNWHPIEWNELLDGKLGPWTMINDGERAISICHTPGPLTERAGECGVWTDPRFRGRGYAAATAAAWVPLVRAPGRHLFYRTDTDNLSSQRVAQRLNLLEIGWTWRFHRPRRGEAENLHPLCSLRRGTAGT